VTWLCGEFDEFVMDLMTLWWISWLCDELSYMHFCEFVWYVNWACINMFFVKKITSVGYG
jgi:hypothetical protein